MIDFFVKDHVLLQFWPCMCHKNPKIEKGLKCPKILRYQPNVSIDESRRTRWESVMFKSANIGKNWRKEGREHVPWALAPLHPVTPVLPYRREYKQQNVISNVRTQHGSRDKIAWGFTTTTVQGHHHIGKTNKTSVLPRFGVYRNKTF